MLEVSADVSPILSHFTVVKTCTIPEPGRGQVFPGATFARANISSGLGLMEELSLLELLSEGQVFSLMHGGSGILELTPSSQRVDPEAFHNFTIPKLKITSQGNWKGVRGNANKISVLKSLGLRL